MKRLILIVLTLTLLLSGCTKQTSKLEIQKIWVKIDPIQCLGNPWQQDWLNNHNMNYSLYPQALKNFNPEINIIKEYYGKKGVIIYDIKSKATRDIVCNACSCPTGTTLYFLIDDSNTNKMLEFGYSIAEEKELP